MSEQSIFWTTNAVGDGLVGGYTMAQTQAWMRALWLNDNTTEGVLLGYQNALAVTNPADHDLAINTGAAIVYGFFYQNTASVTKTPALPVVGTTGWRLVLRASWAAQTVRITLLESADGVPAAPAVTQVDATTWDISLATGTTTTGGVVAITDMRGWCHPNVQVTPAMISNRSRWFLVPAVAAYNNTISAAVARISTRGWPMADAVNTQVLGDFYVPADYDSALEIRAVGESAATGDIYVESYCCYAALGETPLMHSDTIAFEIIAVTANVSKAVHTLTPAALAAFDYVGIRFKRDASNVLDTASGEFRFWGWLISYVADS